MVITLKNKVVIGIFAFLLVFGWFYEGLYYPKDYSSKDTIVFSVKKGQGVKEIARNLKSSEIIKSSTLFQMYIAITGNASKIQAGDYELSKSMNIPAISKMLVFGETSRKPIKIIEGWTIEDIASYLEENKIFSSKDFLPAINSNEAKKIISDAGLTEGKPKNSSLEGYIFPDTYQVNYDTTPKELVDNILSNLTSKITPELKKEITAKKKSMFEIIIMASIIEKEVKGLNDKKIVSGILWKRMKIGMPLQVDATLLYKNDIEGNRVLIEDTKEDSPYNTYTNQGLPIGPICNPGLESIIAAVYPQDSPYLYYLSARNGKTVFSRTFEEHKVNKAKYIY